jgi:hypothetical protein
MGVHLQKVIGVDKKNPYFTICQDTCIPCNLHVFFGAALMEVVPADKENPEFKLLIARLYNSGIRVKSITDVFGTARTTMKRWGDALKSADAECLSRALSGPGAPRKLTAEIRSFIQVRFRKIYQETRYNYSALIREEIKEIFGEDISSESLRPIFNELKKIELDEGKESTNGGNRWDLSDSALEHRVGDTQMSESREQTSDGQGRCFEHLCDQEEEEQDCNRKNSLAFYSQDGSQSLGTISNELKKIEVMSTGGQDRSVGADTCDLPDSVLAQKQLRSPQIIEGQKGTGDGSSIHKKEEGSVLNRKNSLSFYSSEIAFCYHLGVLLFSSEIYKFSHYVKDEVAKQFLVTVLLGAKNIEQTKTLDFNALDAMLGMVTSNRFIQRRQLSQMATDDNITELLKFNAQIVNANQYSDFYYDPHVKRYTGAEKILKGWCPAIRGGSKIINMDFIHVAPDGHPVYVEPSDNFSTMAERFVEEIKDFRSLLDCEDKILSFIVDRGIFAFEVFETIMADNCVHIITWEKGYKKGKWDDGKIDGAFSFLRQRNNSRDLRKYDFEYIDQEWKKKNDMRQLIVRATNPKGRCIEVSILTDDKGREAREIIELMFNRWIQENDFKYEEKHFGINEITSYSVSSYKKLQNLVEDKQTKRGEYKAFERQAQLTKAKLKNVLLKKHTIKNNKRREELEKEIEELSNELDQTKVKMSEIDKEGSKIEELIENEYMRFNTQNKKYMDYIKIIARNIFYKVLQPFKQEYDNYRDDHVLFRNLSQSHGLVSFTDEEVHATIFPTAHYQPKVRKIIEEIFQQMNNQRPRLADGSGRVVRLELGKKTDNALFIIQKPDIK